MKFIETMHSYHLLELLFSNSNVSYVLEEWNQQYEAVEIKTRNGLFKSRFAQRTPNKKGYFFAMWKKDENNTNVPFTEDDLENQSWETGLNNTAAKTQVWQCAYFNEIVHE